DARAPERIRGVRPPRPRHHRRAASLRRRATRPAGGESRRRREPPRAADDGDADPADPRAGAVRGPRRFGPANPTERTDPDPYRPPDARPTRADLGQGPR